ncbi:MAG TPA: helix-turn-helix domain-containing protein [Labilithrix sp.]
MTTRSYDSPLRAEQVERTREKILEAFAEQLAEGREELSIPRVAKRAGVATRTVYHHYPNREAQIEALAEWINRRAAPDEVLPTRLRDLPAFSQQRSETFFAHEALMRAQLAAGIAVTVRARRRKKREEAIDAAVARARVSSADARAAGALVKHLISAKTGLALLDDYRLDRPTVTRTMRWAVELVVAALECGEGPLE